MRTHILRRPSPALVVACLALLVSLGGTGVAAVAALPSNSVGTPQLQAGAVTTAKLATGAVTTQKLGANAVTSDRVKNFSLTKADFAPGQLPAGAQGPVGPAGPAGPQGPKGDPGVIGAVNIKTASVAVDGGTASNAQYVTRETTAQCAAGDIAISGGAGWSDSNNDLELFIRSLVPVLNTQGQVVAYRGAGGNDSGQDSTFTVYAVCTKA